MPIRWPWVSRGLYDELRRQYAEVVRSNNASWWALRGQNEQLLASYADLLGKYHELALPRLAGSREPAVMPERETSLVSQVIREQAGGDPRLTAHLRTYAGQLKREGQTEEEIAQALTSWTSTEAVEF